MGFLAKQRTKSRVAASAHPTSIPGEAWLTDGLPRLAAIVRAGASSIGARADLRSSSLRGGDFLGIGSAIRSADSTIWIEQVGYREWDVAVGMATVKGAALDWQIKLQASGSEGPVTATISTPTVLMKDGAQIHKDEYLELREILTAGLTATVPPEMDGEVASSAQGLEGTVPLPFATEAITPYDGTFTIATSQGAASALDRLRSQLHFRRSTDRPTADRWLIGLDSSSEPSWADLVVEDRRESLALFEPEDGADGVVLRFAVHLGHDATNDAANIVATNHAKRFAACVLALLRTDDQHATINGGGAITDGLG